MVLYLCLSGVFARPGENTRQGVKIRADLQVLCCKSTAYERVKIMNLARHRSPRTKMRWNRRTIASVGIILIMLLGLAACSVPGAVSAVSPSASTLPAATVAAPATSAPIAQADTAVPATAAPVPTAAAATAPAATAAPTAAANASAGMALGDFSAAIRTVVQQAKPAVVQITNEQYQVDGSSDTPFTVPAGVGSGVIY